MVRRLVAQPVPPRLLLVLLGSAFASNPVVLHTSVADPHIHIFDGTAYMYAGRDRDPDATSFVMPDWRVWSSKDLVTWTHETTITPGQTYIGANTTVCFAVDVGFRRGAYHFYFSDGASSFGVMKATVPTLSDAHDVLGKALADKASIGGRTHPYDPTVLVEDDADQTAYIVFGRNTDPSANPDPSFCTHCKYLIAELDDTMDGFAEDPKAIVFLPGPGGGTMPTSDKSTLHKYGTFRLNFHRFDHFELDLRGHAQP